MFVKFELYLERSLQRQTKFVFKITADSWWISVTPTRVDRKAATDAGIDQPSVIFESGFLE